MIKPDHLIDARGYRCPVPTLKLRKFMETLPAGANATLWADDPMAIVDVPHFCMKNNYIIKSTHKLDKFWAFVVAARQKD
ncbi:sulfurtransferase TusA family protein [Asticcacaulis machinosus]|uniref:Sulfurtransferase TusA family protein n=1 Tax=Asticcacaulis machinosus TaxID=2984211 RepID=A0ABT5HF21_9CAUL|nr:sulfurtransferase TusA family protein [Asticcacaulis machinosus]MDC7674849.1 sulfurtransferase TusA family protein [Asticcacaulis machinosus]